MIEIILDFMIVLVGLTVIYLIVTDDDNHPL
jgi:hypothetical protein